MAGLIERLRFLFTGRRQHVDQQQPMRSKVDAAQNTSENRKHWANADSLGPNAALDPVTRQRTRDRSRYEALNNSYLKGLIRSTASDLIGTGPRPEVTIPGDRDGELAKVVEAKFIAWARTNLIGRKYRTLHKSYVRDGDGFLVLDTRPESDDPVKLFLRTVEADQCETPPEFAYDRFVRGGVRVDRCGVPVLYYFIKYHPGESGMPFASALEFEAVRASGVLHWFAEDRAGQTRGLAETTPSLPLFSQLRRYSLATLTAAEIAAMLAGVLETNLPPDGQALTVDSWEMVELVRGALLAAPAGWKATQFKPEQPTATFAEFERTKLGEAGRCVNAPLNVTTGNSSGYNFSSGRLDHLPYQRYAWIDRDDFEQIVADRVFREWASEAVTITGHLPDNLPPIEQWSFAWNWDGFDEIDQTKAASADDTRLKNGTATLGSILTERQGVKWRDVVDQIAREIEYCKARGVRHPMEAPAAAEPQTPIDQTVQPDDDTDDEGDPDPPAQRFSRNGFSRNGVHHD